MSERTWHTAPAATPSTAATESPARWSHAEAPADAAARESGATSAGAEESQSPAQRCRSLLRAWRRGGGLATPRRGGDTHRPAGAAGATRAGRLPPAPQQPTSAHRQRRCQPPAPRTALRSGGDSGADASAAAHRLRGARGERLGARARAARSGVERVRGTGGAAAPWSARQRSRHTASSTSSAKMGSEWLAVRCSCARCRHASAQRAALSDEGHLR